MTTTDSKYTFESRAERALYDALVPTAAYLVREHGGITDEVQEWKLVDATAKLGSLIALRPNSLLDRDAEMVTVDMHGILMADAKARGVAASKSRATRIATGKIRDDITSRMVKAINVIQAAPGVAATMDASNGKK